MNRIFFNNYKCFKQKDIELELNQFNIIIGRNNSGKSSIIDIVELLSNSIDKIKEIDSFPTIKFYKSFSSSEIESVFHKTTSGGRYSKFENHFEFGKRYIDKEILLKLDVTTKVNSVVNYASLDGSDDALYYEGRIPEELNKLASRTKPPFYDYKIIRVAAERNVKPELDNKELQCNINGDGITNIINKYINNNKLDSKKVECELLEALNTIMYPDSIYIDIVVQQIDSDKDDQLLWEIYLEEENGIRIPLSSSGSGLKTIIIVLVNLLLMPEVMKTKPNNIIFAFEELENNLHPALQRNLYKYIFKWINDNDSTVFFTTHSSTLINMFGNFNNLSIIHVVRSNGFSTANIVNTKLKKYDILDDLDIKASDLLQSNGVIWVEGPSDRVYIRKWIEIMSDNSLLENEHYQIMYYGGRLLSNLRFGEDDDPLINEELIDILLLNRNSIILIDSDKTYNTKPLNDTKKRIKQAYSDMNSLCWITNGKEIENYIPKRIIDTIFEFKSNKHEFNQYDRIEEYLSKHDKTSSKRFLRDKIFYAKKFSTLMTIDDINNNKNLKSNIESVITQINSWSNRS